MRQVYLRHISKQNFQINHAYYPGRSRFFYKSTINMLHQSTIIMKTLVCVLSMSI